MAIDEKLAARMVEEAPDAVIFAATDGVIQAWNHAAERIFGFSSDDAIGQSLDLIIPERFREAHWRGFDAAIAADKLRLDGRALPTRSVRKDGETIYVELSFGLVHDAAGAVIGALGHARDITERWLKEREERAAKQAQSGA